MKKVLKAIRDVRIRTDAPEIREDNVIGMIHKGKQLTLNVEILEGQKPGEAETNNIWYRVGGHLYLWSGGFVEVAEGEVITASFSDSVDYGKKLKLPETLLGNRGAGIRVGVLDTGIYQKHPDFEGYFENPITPSKNFTGSDVGFKDKFGHGTHVAGLIGARNNDDIGVTGIAPDCDMFNYKVLNDNNTSSKTFTKRALDHIKSTNISKAVFNLSFGLSKFRFEQIKDEFQKVLDLKNIMVSAAGNDQDLLKNELLYPANHPGIFAIGSVSQQFEKGTLQFSRNLDYIIPSNNLVVTSIKKNGFYTRDGFSSMATALMSGVICLIVKKYGFRSKEELKEIIDEMADEYRDEITYEQPQILKP